MERIKKHVDTTIPKVASKPISVEPIVSPVLRIKSPTPISHPTSLIFIPTFTSVVIRTTFSDEVDVSAFESSLAISAIDSEDS
jgi:hypothetical protein